MPTCKNNNKNPTTQPKRVAEGIREQNKNINKKMPRRRQRNKREYKTRAANEDDIADRGEPTTEEPGFQIFPRKGANDPHAKIIGHIAQRKYEINRASAENSDGKTTQNNAYLKNLTAKRASASSSGFMEPELPTQTPTYKTKPPPKGTSETIT